MDDFRTMFRTKAGVPLAAIPPLVLIGILAIVASVPTFFEAQIEAPTLPIINDIWGVLADIAQHVRRTTSTHVFSVGLTLLAQVGLLLISMIPLAALIRSIYEADGEPLRTAILTLMIGVFSIPVLMWIARIVHGLTLTLWAAYRWLGDILRAPIQIIGSIAIAIIVIVVAAWWIRGLFGNRTVRLWTLGVATAVGILLLLFIVLRLQDTSAIRYLWAWFGVALRWLLAGLGFVVSWLIRIVVAAALVLIIISVLAQLGAAFWKPLVAALSAGSKRSSTADLAAGSGVALSIILTATVVNADFQRWLFEVMQEVPWGSPVLVLSEVFDTLLPTDYKPFLTDVLRGFSGFPEFAVISVSCLTGNLSLSLSDRERQRDGINGLATLAVGRTILAVALAIPALIVLWQMSDD